MTLPVGLKKALLVAVGLASSGIFTVIALRHLSLYDLERVFAHASLWPWLPLAVLSYLAGHWVRGARCRLLVSREAKLTRSTATNIVVLGYAVNNVLPARLGELARAGMLADRSGLPFVHSLTVTFLERVLDGLVLLLALVVAGLALPEVGLVLTTLQLGGVVFGVAALAVIVAVVAPTWLLALASRSSLPLGARVHRRVVALTGQVTGGVAYLGRPGDALRVLGLSALVWAFEAGMFLALLPAFGLRASPAVALLALGVTNLGILIPSSPGFIGPFHFFCMTALTSVGVAGATALSYAVLAHLAFYIPITAWGLLVILAYGLTLGETLARARRAEPLALGDARAAPARLAHAPEAPSAFLRALVEALVPAEAGEHEAVDGAARFVAGALAALPARLSALHELGMLGFRALTALRFARGFASLPLERRRAWVERWAYGRLTLARQLFRATRSTSLLAFHEQPQIRARLRPELTLLRVKGAA
ncbi:MAG: lysylphosphatidylglycerol synthase domain-containing protein [Sorangiineae bacterium]|nr:lysylphosphatidylglycerol synthase domain-containing protein [Polyangiaceae bacterium]MEB2323046.1 lysylphosphatidylglycerol synthase domain-containing protein [Sorangiineae bacterium]